MKIFSLLITLIIFFTPFVSVHAAGKITGNEFNPAISLILVGGYVQRDEGDIYLPGFQLGGETALPQQGFATGENELSFSSNIDDKFYGALTTALVNVNGETSVEVENAFIETLALGNGLTIKGGRFFSGVGYLNEIHEHAHDFADRPLVYDALFGGHLVDTGLQVKWLAPVNFYLSLGSEITSGQEYPSGENVDGNTGLSFFMKTGGDLNESANWQLGLSHYSAQFDLREAGVPQDNVLANNLLDGKVNISGVDFVYKWAPQGNNKERNFKLQGEYFVRDEEGQSVLTENSASANASYKGKQKGYYLQSVYQFKPAWRIGLRYDFLTADNSVINFVSSGITQQNFLKESSLGEANNPNRSSIMLDYSPSHFSQIRVQYESFDNGLDEANNLFRMQYTMSLGSHGSHQY